MLGSRGHDAIHTSNVGLATASDRAILEAAVRDERIVVTFDADFHALIALSGLNRPSVIRLRMEGLRAAEQAALVDRVAVQWEEDLAAGALLTVLHDTVRSRRLPLVRG
jgi:predicted nuclease of predicted toxin-antitoxin system